MQQQSEFLFICLYAAGLSVNIYQLRVEPFYVTPACYSQHADLKVGCKKGQILQHGLLQLH